MQQNTQPDNVIDTTQFQSLIEQSANRRLFQWGCKHKEKSFRFVFQKGYTGNFAISNGSVQNRKLCKALRKR
jgi:hypothetical protein